MTRSLTVDIGGTKCSAAITDDAGVHELTTWPTDGTTGNLERAVTHYGELLALGAAPVSAVGICFGGPVDHTSATVKRSVHVPGWEGFDFRTWAHQSLDLPAAVDNDAKCGALAEAKHGSHAADDLLYVTVSTGIGAGVVVGGRLLRGATNEAGEIGHTRVSDDERLCSCGRTGCLERMCSGYWLEQDHGRPAALVLADDETLQAYCRTFATGLTSAVLLYNPSVIVLGGGVTRIGQRLVDGLAASLESDLGSWRHMTPRIVISEFGDDGVHLGAMELTRDLL